MNSFRQFIEQPFTQGMSAGSWFLFIGFVMILAIGWRMIFAALTNVGSVAADAV